MKTPAVQWPLRYIVYWNRVNGTEYSRAIVFTGNEPSTSPDISFPFIYKMRDSQHNVSTIPAKVLIYDSMVLEDL